MYVTSGSRPWVTSSLGLIQKEDDNLLLLCLNSLAKVAGNERIQSFLGRMWMLTHCHMMGFLFFSLCSFYRKYILWKGLWGRKVKHLGLQKSHNRSFPGSAFVLLVRVHLEQSSSNCFLIHTSTEHLGDDAVTHGDAPSCSPHSKGAQAGSMIVGMNWGGCGKWLGQTEPGEVGELHIWSKASD